MVYASVFCRMKKKKNVFPLSQSPEQRMGQRLPPPRPAVAHALRPTSDVEMLGATLGATVAGYDIHSLPWKIAMAHRFIDALPNYS